MGADVAVDVGKDQTSSPWGSIQLPQLPQPGDGTTWLLLEVWLLIVFRRPETPSQSDDASCEREAVFVDTPDASACGSSH